MAANRNTWITQLSNVLFAMVTTWCWCDRHFLRWKMGLERCVLEWPGWRNPLRGSRWRPPSRWLIGSWVMVRQGKKIFLAVERHWEVGRVRDTGARNEMEPHVELILSVTQQPEEPAFAVHHGTNVLWHSFKWTEKFWYTRFIIQHDNKMTLQFQYLLD